MPPPGDDDLNEDDLLGDDQFHEDAEDLGGAPDDPKGDAATDDDVQVILSAGGEDEPGPEPDEDALPGATEGGEDVDLSSYSEAARKRIMRERRLKEEARDEARAAHAERFKAQQTAYESTKSLLQLAKETTKDKLEAKRKEWVKAKDVGDNEADVRLQGEVSKLEADLRDIEQSEGQLKPPRPDVESDTSLAAQWKSRNRWFGDPKFAAATAAVRVLDAAVLADGFKPDTQEYFTELNRRIHAELPNLRGRVQRIGDATREARPQPRPITHAPAPKGGQRRPSGNVVMLSQTDVANMQNFKLDPKNPEHVKEYARQKKTGG